MNFLGCLVVLLASTVPSTKTDVLRDYRTLERRCPAPFFAVGPECFYVNRANKTWPMGRATCQRIGGDLAEPLDIYVFLEAIRDRYDSWREKYFWVGGETFSKGSDSSQWTWFSGRPVTAWNTDQVIGREGEDCLMFGLKDDLPMYDYFCNETSPFICEI
ncbi:uncharacterized protein LOC134769029 [Penaeus indicus]|uniref:uncharacterized protein LOC134769029 n=1 Tax=Penaeus indicus TaxID=29960 RepID=UPI00300C022F